MAEDISKILPRRETQLQIQMENPSCYHTLRYDFKPASVNSEEPANLELTSTGNVTITAPNIGGSTSTVFRGQRRPHVKECLLVIDKKTGEMVLQKLTDNITVKATRSIGQSNSITTNSTNNNDNSINQTATPITNNHSNGGGNHNTNHHNENDGPQLSEDSSSSDDDSSSSTSSSSSSSSSSGNSSPNNEGFTF